MNLKRLIFIVLCALSVNTHALLKIEITQGANNAQPIAIVPFAWAETETAPEDIAAIIAADLERSGQFKTLPEKDMLSRPSTGKDINFAQWRILDINHLLIGQLKRVTDESYVVEFQLFNVNTGRQITGYSIPASQQQLRRAAHAVSDIVYEELTGIKGAFNTRIAYITMQRLQGKPRFELEVADTDGHNAKTILRSAQPIMSPSWSPDGQRLAYVSFEEHKPAVYTQSVYKSSKREKVAAFNGINGAPVWSPDGKKLALTLSRRGNPDIYVLDLESKKLTQMTRSLAIDTEPEWLPDARSLVFTSGRGGSPQIYRVDINGGRPVRLTHEGDYNASPSVSADGRYLAMVHKDRGRFRIAVLDQKNGLFRILTDGRLDESPSFAPNGSILLYATEDKGQGVLAAVSVDGRTRQKLIFKNGDIREPAWAPFVK